MKIRTLHLYISFVILFLNIENSFSQKYKVGFKQIKTANGLNISLWYPTLAKDSAFIYTKSLESKLALNGPIADTVFPLIVFSHGFTGCGIQSVFFTEELAKQGYVVAAPDHKDATCELNSTYTFKMKAPEVPFTSPMKWSEQTYRNRKNDMGSVINYMIRKSDFATKIDSNKIAAAGHSLGGYTVFGLAGGWDSWKNDKIKAVLLFSPYLSPFEVRNDIKKVNIPVMYQGADMDISLTPPLSKKGGIYEQSNVPKYYVELSGGSHFEWSNVVCMGQLRISECLEKKKNARLINEYSIAFFDKYLKGKAPEILNGKGGKVKEFRVNEK